MKNQNPQEVLNEILLRMKYDSSKTLSENKEIIFEQGGNYYDQSGKLVGFPGKNNINAPANKIYPSIKNNNYPQQIPTNDISAQGNLNVWFTSKSLTPKPGYIYTKQERADIANSEKEDKKEDEKEDENENELTILVKAFQLFLNEKYPTWYKGSFLPLDSEFFGVYGPYTKKMWNNEKVVDEWLKNRQKYIDRIKFDVNKLINFKRPPLYKQSTKLTPTSDRVVKTTITGEDIEIPKSIRDESGNISSVEESYWSATDFVDYDTFKKNIIDKDGTSYSLYSLGKYKFSRMYGKKFLKSFTIKQPKELKRKDVIFKQVVVDGAFGKFGTIDQDGDLIYYEKWALIKKTGWENWGPFLLNVGSMAIAVAFPATWPLLLISAGMDAGAAYIQYTQGETESAKLSLILALVPFIGKLAIKIPKSVSVSLMNKFAKATTKAEVDAVIAGLNKTELSALKSIREFGDLENAIKSLKTNPEVVKAINQGAKEAPGVAKAVLKKAAVEVGGASASLYYFWDDIKEQSSAANTRIQLINGLFKTINENINLKAFPSITESDINTMIEEIGINDIPIDEIIKKTKEKQEVLSKMMNDSAQNRLNMSILWLKEMAGSNNDQKQLTDTLKKIYNFNQNIIDKKLDPNQKPTQEEINKLK